MILDLLGARLQISNSLQFLLFSLRDFPMQTQNLFFRLFSIFLLSLSLSSCIYRMPGENDISLIPKTNNPDVIGSGSRQDETNFMPGANF